MGAKLSKKKKGYCLGAGKDGESTETTEVEQKETENQEGQKDAAEPNGEKPPADQSETAENEKQNDKKCGVEVTSGETTKEDANKDQKPESKPSTEQEQVEDKNQAQDKLEHVEIKTATPEQESEKKAEVKSPSEDKAKTEHKVKETPSVATEKPTQESKLVTEAEGSGAKLPDKSVTDQSAPVQDEAAVKEIPEPVPAVEAEKVESSPAPLETVKPVLEKAAEEPTQLKESVTEPENSEKVPEKSEQSEAKSTPILKEPAVESVRKTQVVEALVEPTFSEPVPVPEAATVSEPELPSSKSTPVPELESALPASVPESVQTASNEPVPDSAPDSAPEPVEPTVLDAVPEIKTVETSVTEKPASVPEECVQETDKLVPCPDSQQISETKHEISSEPLLPKLNEVPEQTTEAQENVESQGSLGCGDQGTNTLQETTPVASSTEQPSENSEKQNVGQETPVIQNGPSEQEQVDARPISTKLEVETKDVEEDHVSDKLSTGQECHLAKEDCNYTTEETLETSKNENDQTASQGIKETPNPSQHCNSEDKIENHETADKDVRKENEPSAPESLDKHGVGNGLPLKEEIKVHLENRSDKDLYDINGQSESNEIQVCNE